MDKLDDDDYRQVKIQCQKETEILEDKGISYESWGAKRQSFILLNV